MTNDLDFLHDSFAGINQKNLGPIIILVEDDRLFGQSVAKYLEKSFGTQVYYFQRGSECLEHFRGQETCAPFCLITDISLENGFDGLNLIDRLKEMNLKFTALAMTGFGSIESAISATKRGVFHYLTKPFELSNLLQLIKDACKKELNLEIKSSELNQQQSLKKFQKAIIGKFRVEPPRDEDFFCGIIGRSPLMKEVFGRIQKVAKSDSTVLITGPSGSGKEMVAQAIHFLSTRQLYPKVSINCGAIPGELLESELFGHTKGAFTGAISVRKGRFEAAQKGTIFLDEIGDMPLLLQVKLLRVLQNKTIEPVGSSTSMEVDVRVITATHHDLEKLVIDGKFREDLFYRLNVIPIRMPALKDRREDIPLLISYFLSKYVSADGRNKIDFSDETLELIMTYDWPGNVRELENLIERLVILRGGNTIRPEDLPAKLYRNNPLASSLYQTIFELPETGIDLKKILSDIEDSLILQALNRTKGNKNKASGLLHLNRTTLIEKMKKKNIDLSITP
jgi:two-component system response regulator PilR (NtrC family)